MEKRINFSLFDSKGDLSRFIEEAVRAHILELTAEQAKAANADVSETDLTSIVAEAWTRMVAPLRDRARSGP